jgi:hypothetical protein
VCETRNQVLRLPRPANLKRIYESLVSIVLDMYGSYTCYCCSISGAALGIDANRWDCRLVASNSDNYIGVLCYLNMGRGLTITYE